MAERTTNEQIPEISSGLHSVLQRIVEDVVFRIGCVCALVTTLEHGKAMPVRAYAFDGTSKQVEEQWRAWLSENQAVVYLGNKKHRNNLGVRAVNELNKSQGHLVSNKLHDLLRPFVNESEADAIQKVLGGSQVVAAPFLHNDEVVGNLIVISRRPLSKPDIDFLDTFGQQAATAIQSQRQLKAMEALQRVVLTLQAKMTDETEALQAIVDAVVQEMGYAGAIVATLESGNALPVRAYAVSAAPNLIHQLEENVGVSLRGPQAVAYLDDERYKDNLSVRAVQGVDGSSQNYLISTSLYDLLRPIAMKPLADLAQRLIGIKQLIAIPFFLEDMIVGNLFVATRSPKFSDREISVLTAFGQQAAVSLHNARLYQMAEERRQISQRFGRMAFSATASVHALRNHIGAVRSYMHLLQMLPKISTERQGEILEEIPLISRRLSKVTDILDNLHEPWQHIPDHPVDVNGSVLHALREVFPGIPLDEQLETITMMGVTVHFSMASDLPKMLTATDMLSEMFRILIKNAVEAILESDGGCDLWIITRAVSDKTVEVLIKDSGKGIKSEDLARIFDMGWSTKGGRGMGFGLFWAQDYVNGLGGVIEAESVWGEGSTFLVRLPASTADAG